MDEDKDIIGKKHTLWSTLKEYEPIEIPIIQRDYAQGRESAAEVRKNILNHILEAIVNGNPASLDFVYGYERQFKRDNKEKVAFIPIDGQQRLTTLWIIHWFLAYQAGLLKTNTNVKELLKKFVYETRPSSADFMSKLCEEDIPKDICFKEYFLKQAPWFDENWKLDPSVMGFITMLDEVRTHPLLAKQDCALLLARLTDDDVEKAAVSFYFLPLKEFGLGEEIYTRMNARGKILNDFEKFKSNFYKIIKQSPSYEEITTKMEYDWVSNLWQFRDKDVYITDNQFLAWLKFITQMLYVKEQKRRETSHENIDFLSFEVLESIYSDEENLRILVASLDMLTADKLLSSKIEVDVNWDNKNGLIHPIKWLLSNPSKPDALKQLCVFAAILYIDKIKSVDGISNYLRVVRNLIGNTKDRGVREWPVMIESIGKLISTDVYTLLRNENPDLQGFRSEQREIERFKALMLDANSGCENLLVEMDNDSLLKGRIGNLIVELAEANPTMSFSLSLKGINPCDVDSKKLSDLFEAYVALRKYNDETADFSGIWGEFLYSPIYQASYTNCVWSTGENEYVDYANHPVTCCFARELAESHNDVKSWAKNRQKSFVKKMVKENGEDLASINDPKIQLYLLYIITSGLLGWHYSWFFARGEYNFTWVRREGGYKTPFFQIYDEQNQIFQTYPSVFRGDYIRDWRTPSVLITSNLQRTNHNCKHILEDLVTWATEK